MSPIFLERQFDPPLDRAGFVDMLQRSADCLPLYRVNWQQSLLADNGQRMLCHFQAADCESVRQATGHQTALQATAWHGSYHDTGRELMATAIVERNFSTAADLDALQQREDAHQWCLDTYGVTFIATCLRADRQRMLCLYHAPDADAVRSAQRQAGMPFTEVWACQHHTPAHYTR